MTVQELIEELNQIEDKSVEVLISYEGDSGRDYISGTTIHPKKTCVYINSNS